MTDPLMSAGAVLYGIPNCDTVKKARAWLVAKGQSVPFHDLRRDGLPAAELERWLQQVGRARLVNRQGTTWRRLPPADQALADTDAGALALLQREPTVIKRPVARWPDGAVTVGFDATDWARRLGMPAAG